MRSGRCQPAKITNQLKRSVIREARENRQLSSGLVGKLVTPYILASAVRRIFDDVGLHRRRGCKVLYLTKDHKQHRKQWAQEHKSWGEEDWDRVIWSDECYVHMGNDRGTVWVTRAPSKRFDEDCLIPTFKQLLLWVTIWACIMRGSWGPMGILDYREGKKVEWQQITI